MSMRHVKKVYGSSNDVPLHDSGSDVEIVEHRNVKSKPFNVFDLLNENEVNEENESDKSCEDDCRVDNETKQKKKKRKRKKKVAQCDAEKFEEVINETENLRDEGASEEDEIDRTIREVNKLLGEPSASGTSSKVPDDNQACLMIEKSKESVLYVQHKNLNPYNELKKIFGSKTVQADQSKRRNRGRMVKKSWLVSPRDNWPQIGKFGLSMSLDHSMENVDGVQYFVFEHSQSYMQVQEKFLQAVESLNPENIVSIINVYPYHVDTLLQLSELCKLSEDLQMSAEFTERALYSLESAFHPSFNITTANCRLDYRKQQNRALFITIFRHLIFIGGRACYRTSLEFCKLLLSLDPSEDPLAVVLAIDFYALRAKEYQWFVDFCQIWEKSRNLSQLPNMAYSLALANFHLGNRDDADQLLCDALIMFPGVLLPLLDKCGVQADSKVLGHDFFNNKAKASSSIALEKLQELYLARSDHLWREDSILPWLEAQVHKVLQRVEAGDDFVKFCQMKRVRRYRGKLPRNILRHVILSDIKEVTVNLQENLQNQRDRVVLSHDPLPPENTIDIYTRPTASRPSSEYSSNILSLFLSSIFTHVEQEIAAAFDNRQPDEEPREPVD